MKVLALLFTLSFFVACSDSDSTDPPCETAECPIVGDDMNDAGQEEDASNDFGQSDMAGDDAGLDLGSDQGEELPVLEAVERHESDVLYGWVVAGQPSEARVETVVATGATIISLRLESEDPFDEPALIDGLGGAFIRYPTTAQSYNDVAFRESMYDLYDSELEAGNLVYLHCASSNRAGASWALYQAERKGVDAEEAVAMGKEAGLASLESTVRSILGI